MPESENLNLHEELLLLALKDEKGTTAIESRYNLAVGGAILADLLLLGRIQVQKTVIDDDVAAGQHSLDWEGTNNNDGRVASGVYFYEVKRDGQLEKMGKMALVK